MILIDLIVMVHICPYSGSKTWLIFPKMVTHGHPPKPGEMISQSKPKPESRAGGDERISHCPDLGFGFGLGTATWNLRLLKTVSMMGDDLRL